MRLFCVLWAALGLATPAVAQIDASVDGGVRTLPFGAAVGANIGYGHMLWGDRTTPLYGYLRPVFRGQTSYFVNSVEGRVDVAPLAPIVLSGGVSRAWRNIDLGAFDCAKVDCRGGVTRVFGILGLGAAYGQLFAKMEFRADKLYFGERKLALVGDHSSNLSARAAGDRLLSVELIAGAKVSEPFSVAFRWVRQNMDRSNASNLQSSLFFRYVWESGFAAVLGAGLYDSSEMRAGPDPTLYTVFSWELLPSLGLF
jgi:hypothetical protein